jgi:hypothetical protein
MEDQLAEITALEVAPRGIVRNVFFVEHDPMSATMESAQNRAIRSGMSISPGGGERKAKDRNLHRVFSGMNLVLASR